MEKISKIIEHLAMFNEQRKLLARELGPLKQKYLEFTTTDVKEHQLETTTITVPHEFWESTAMSEEDFLETRFPSWSLLERKNLRYGTLFILRKKPEYQNHIYSIGDWIVSKTVVEKTPQVDWKTLKAENKDLYDEIAVQRTIIELDQEKLDDLVSKNPETLAILRRHLIMSKPEKRVNTSAADE